MTPPRAGRRAAALALLPLCVWLAGVYSASRLEEPGAAEARASLQARAEEVARAFHRVRAEGERLAVLARDRGVSAARTAARRSDLAHRVDGIGVVDPRGGLLEWTGTPETPPPVPGLRIGVDGLRTRLNVRCPPDRAGRSGTATLLLDGDTPDLAFVALLPDRRARATVQEVHFGLDQAPVPPPHVLVAPIEDGGTTVGWVRLQDVRAAHLAAERRSQALAASAALAALLAGAAALRRPPRTWRGLAAYVAALAACRALLVATQACSHLLPRELGSPSRFGTTAGFGAFASPADLALTCLAWWLSARALARAGRGTEGPGFAFRAGSLAAAGLSVAGLLALSVSLGENARLDPLRLASFADLLPQALLLAGWVLALEASAELCVLFLRRLPGGPGAPRVATLLASLPLAALATAFLLQTQARNEVERLRSEFAPQVLEQRSRREGALLAAVSEAATSPRTLEALAATEPGEDPYTAYRLWVGGTLFRQGLQSSLDLYRDDGTLVSHFAFDLPPLHEPPPRALEAEPTAVPENDRWALGFRQALLHAEMPVVAGGRRLGAVVAHVTDDPSNLSFLPSIAPYLAALGPGHPGGARGEPGGVPDYVLYDAGGGILLQTLDDPPPPSAAMREAAASGSTLRLDVGDEPWTALPLRDAADPGRLHLLLMPARSALDYLGAFVRLALASLFFLVLRVVLGYGVRRARWAAAWSALRGSFYRKLLATLLLASVLPLIGLSLFLWTYIGARGQAALVEDATRLVRVVRKVIEDYASSAERREEDTTGGPVLDDVILHWLGRMVGQEILVYRDGTLLATSKRELFSSGLLTPRLPGEVADALTRRHVPYLVRTLALGQAPIPVVYTSVRFPEGGGRTIVAVPLVLQEQEAARAVEQVVEMLLLATVALGTLLAAAVSPLARNVARPVRLLVDATARIAAGDYGARLSTGSRDELAGLVNGFNAMAAALAAQRGDLERRRDYMEALLRHATTGVLSTDARGRLVTVNPAARSLLDGSQGPPRTGDILADAVAGDPELAPLAPALRRRAGTGDPEDVDLLRGGRAQRVRVVQVDLPDPDGGPPGALLLLEDVTDLMRSNQLAAWAEMARAIAHEIKNPLTPIQLSTEHLERVLRDRRLLPSPEIESCLQTVFKQVRALREIASEFSAYAKLPDLAPRPTDPGEFLREVVAPYRAAHPPGVAIEEDYAAAGTAAVDARVLARAVVNLIENALQAMPQGGRLRLAVRRRDGEVLLSVSDTGPGLDPRVRARLFTPYFSTKSSGTGLGLAIVRRAVEAHGGHVEVSSAPGSGTTFTIHLPAV
ncbi:MAG TPA: ATP-binding protein [Candidatus Polarisedimenticolaceae bacterium]|nr:ATP-binding protein [Candidatus Polarisedimenticolaceae bacterium]